MLQNILALIYDFDQTLIPGFMQEPLFKKYGVDGDEFWAESAALRSSAAQKGINMDGECAYMNLILRYVKNGKFPSLSNQELQDLGKEIVFYTGLPEFLGRIKENIEKEPRFEKHQITVEHYVISTGLKPMILGSGIGDKLNDVFASEFMEDDNGVVCEIARTVGHLKKTEFIHLINKGGNVDKSVKVEDVVPNEYRRIPFQNMCYIGDGQTDISSMATINGRGGTSLAAYNPSDKKYFREAFNLR
ncbi:haloacid dehalogenase-like hydrolase, partial [Candidatus Woesearchaeota archaeon]|nr:haloacid dehalogenase-like hydrolase [Candidatus Woesearchaeota archaeon]